MTPLAAVDEGDGYCQRLSERVAAAAAAEDEGAKAAQDALSGGLGIITALTVAQPPRGAEALRDEIRKCRKLTNKPFGVNITLLPVGVPPDYEGIIKVIIEEVTNEKMNFFYQTFIF